MENIIAKQKNVEKKLNIVIAEMKIAFQLTIDYVAYVVKKCYMDHMKVLNLKEIVDMPEM